MEEHYKISIAKKIYILLNKSVPWLIGIFLFFNPFPHTTAISEISFYLSLLFFLILLFKAKLSFSFRTPLSVPFALFVIWSCFGLVFALNKGDSFHDIYVHLLKNLVVFYIIINFFNSKEKFQTLSWLMAISASVYVIVLLIFNYVVMGHNYGELLGAGFPETSPNILALVLLFGLLFFIFLLSAKNFLYQNIILILSIALSSFALLVTQCRSAIFALAGGFIVIFPRRKQIVVSFLFVTVILVLGFLVAGSRLDAVNILAKLRGDGLYTMKERVGIWMCYAQIIKERPLVGTGFGMSTFDDEKLLVNYNQRVDKKYRISTLYHGAHNMMLSTAVRIGLVGLAIFLYTLFAFLRMGWRLIRNARDEFVKFWSLCLMGAFVAFLIHGMFEDTLSGPPAVILYVTFAMMTILWRIQSESATISNITSRPFSLDVPRPIQ